MEVSCTEFVKLIRASGGSQYKTRFFFFNGRVFECNGIYADISTSEGERFSWPSV